jgi:hypothetical protein
MAIIRRPKSTSTAGHYITNDVLLPEVLRAKQLGRITDELAAMLYMIADRYSRKWNFATYSFRTDMVSFAMLNLMANALKFSAERTNPFTYYTTAINNSFLQFLAEEKNHRKIRDALSLDAGIGASFSYSDESRAGFSEEHEIYDEHGEISHSGYDIFRKPIPEEKEVVTKPVQDDTIDDSILIQLRMAERLKAQLELKDKAQKKPIEYDE